MQTLSRAEKDRIKNILTQLDDYYGTDTRCYLHYETTWQLLIAVILSAQCTDARVNTVTPALFARYPDAETMAAARLIDVEKIIHSVGFYHNKAKNIIACSKDIVIRYGGEVPRSIEDLTSLPGVGRKTANVIRGNIYGDPSVVVDTHVKRIARKLGLTKNTEPEKVEKDLMRVLPQNHWILCNLQLIALGREICTARNPKCDSCFLQKYCPEGKKNV